MRTCCFCGHSYIDDIYDLECRFDNIIHKLASNGVVTFYNGGYGQFDDFALSRIAHLRTFFPHFQNYIVSPYLDNKYLSAFEHKVQQNIASIIYPFEYKVMPQYAIVKRNEWMVDHSDVVIAYINHTFGGAHKMLSYAKRKGKKIINLGNIDKASI